MVSARFGRHLASISFITKRAIEMAKKTKHVVIAYFPAEDKASDAADQLKSWEKATDGVKLGGINILTWKDGKIKTHKVGGRDAGKDAGWGMSIGRGDRYVVWRCNADRRICGRCSRRWGIG